MTSSDWEALFGDNTGDNEETSAAEMQDETTEDESADLGIDDDDDDEGDIEDNEEEEVSPKKKKSIFPKKPAKKAPKPKKEKKGKQRDSVHGLRKRESDSGITGQNTAKIVIAVVGVAAVLAVVGMVGAAMNKKIQAVNETNNNLTQQIASRTMTVYVAKRDIAKGDDIVLSGDNANAEISQIYSSLSDSSYVQEGTSGYAQVDIAAGQPIMANEVADTNPVTELLDAAAEAEAKYIRAKEMPYKITADFVDLSTGDSLVESRDLTLDAGANEKAFNTEAEEIDGYVLTSIQVDGEGVHAYGISEKSMKEGVVTMYYFTTKGGWGRHEIKGNIRVKYGYVKKDDPAAAKTDVFDDSAWIDEPEEEASAESAADGETIDEEVAEAVEEALSEE